MYTLLQLSDYDTLLTFIKEPGFAQYDASIIKQIQQSPTSRSSFELSGYFQSWKYMQPFTLLIFYL